MQRVSSLGSLARLELQDHERAEREWHAEVADWQAMITAVRDQESASVSSGHISEHKKWQTMIWQVRDEVEVDRSSFDPNSLEAAKSLAIFTPPDHPGTVSIGGGGGDPAFRCPEPEAELEPAVDDEDDEDNLAAWHERQQVVASSAPAEQQQQPDERGYSHPEFGGGSGALGAPPLGTAPRPQTQQPQERQQEQRPQEQQQQEPAPAGGAAAGQGSAFLHPDFMPR